MINDLLTWFVAAVKQEPTLAALQARVFPDVAPEQTPNPCMIYQFIENEGEPVLDAGAATHGTLAFQVRIYGDSRREANAFRESIRLKFQGMTPQAIGGGWKIEGSAWGDLPDTYEKETKDYGALGVVEFHVAR
ncbi:tail completion protein gp17 [Luteolibacter soli]|uniref:DUF3168 domain-containing protein n=1 Tax=Luteolibacter soli TaxID=3135280 RepID=A0ABU9AYE5_9BACT